MKKTLVVLLVFALVCSCFSAGLPEGKLKQLLGQWEALKNKQGQSSSVGDGVPIDPDAYLNVTQLIQSKGYPCIDHTVITQDGYVLSLQNIPGNGPPVLLQHGLLDSAATWVMDYPSQSLGYILADNGFDVWLGNSRGNVYCQANTHFSNTTQDFWNFSWDDMATYDLPARINYIISQTGAKQIGYVGHSEGTEMVFAALSNDTFNLTSKIGLFVALAPVMNLGNVSEFLRDVASIRQEVIKLVFGSEAIFYPDVWYVDQLPQLCSEDPDLCEETICFLAGCESASNYNRSRIPVIVSKFPSGSSVQNFVHYMQSIQSNLFQKYDFGRVGNQQHYGQNTPPLYNISNYDLKSTAYFYGSKDKMADPINVQQLLAKIPIQPVYVEEIQDYGHGDFVWGLDANQKLYPQVVKLFQKFLPK